MEFYRSTSTIAAQVSAAEISLYVFSFSIFSSLRLCVSARDIFLPARHPHPIATLLSRLGRRLRLIGGMNGATDMTHLSRRSSRMLQQFASVRIPDGAIGDRSCSLPGVTHGISKKEPKNPTNLEHQ